MNDFYDLTIRDLHNMWQKLYAKDEKPQMSQEDRDKALALLHSLMRESLGKE